MSSWKTKMLGEEKGKNSLTKKIDMEVLSFITQNPNFIDKLSIFLKEYDSLIFDCQNDDTQYFINSKTKKNEIYLHFLPNDLEYEFSYNYTKKEQQRIVDYLGNDKLYLFDIQFKDEVFLCKLLNDFKDYLNHQNTVNQLDKSLTSHPQKGIIKL